MGMSEFRMKTPKFKDGKTETMINQSFDDFPNPLLTAAAYGGVNFTNLH